mmetsp:Transcript_41150/g.96750  ORF Transcript_41150/g.96750 Transcript_41150/m.96750 type:complete len:208 (-) Transcript_41150:220-843(-)|eukprot:CAMPEP_0177720366 /NCGR_PEP_ID=MMETSP0484_2-20121128/16587_1 /TAXON_ID=354590 /ORGANISM="Rhodomonas lens, Strain RHODO" /LENGTH=207 /DNA_ID=CAMNT_0019232623 /DNA_START=258 /DNA_END=881 /DNA_ORIENTATION=-
MAEETSLFTVTKRVKEAILLINALDESKLSVVIKRLLKTLGMKGEKPFTEEEMEQLQQHLSLNASELDTVLEACSFFLERSAYRVVKSDDLSAQLQAAGLSQDHGRTFAAVWQAEAPALLRRLREAEDANGPRLDSVDWQIRVQTARSGLSKLADPSAIISLGLKGEDKKSKALGGARDVVVEMNQEQLLALLQKLDIAQSQLDALS